MSGFPIVESNPVEHAAALPERADVVIVGGGVIGVMTAYFLARKGRRVVLLEKGRIAGEQSSRNWGWVRQTGRDAAELPVMVEANRLWPQLQRETNEDLGLEQSGLTYLAASQSKLAEYEEFIPLARMNGVDSRMLSGAEVAAMMPTATRRYAGALHTPSDYRAEPWIAVPGLARAAVRAGALIRENCAVRGLDIAAGQIAGVISEAGRVAADQVLVAGGAWSSLLLRRHGVKIPQLSVKNTVLATEPVADVYGGGAADDILAFRRRKDGGYTLAPEGFHEFYLGPDALRATRPFLRAFLRDPIGRSYWPAAPAGFPDGWTQSRRWSMEDASPFERMRILNPAPHAKTLRKLLADFQVLFPQLGAVRMQAAWAGMIDVMPDVVPIVDEVPDVPGLWIGTGMSGHGFGIGPAFGRILADLMSGGEAGHDMERFRFGRFTDGSKLVIGPGM
ncbi:FAD-binding oxidoreductase [Roseovarius faecimaris]|uniref:FAD-binding oxidoreductase n=1 Tax=Roseovarius faecimaris TaxID=2494550 RepID=A0A6I6ILW7_9RHOB|nr:FAD-binding oxidoreductase [Roseovarius faecimaris]QGX97969.1 FAD-binding oxidoreductase [Roseovarius faecimaris]